MRKRFIPSPSRYGDVSTPADTISRRDASCFARARPPRADERLRLVGMHGYAEDELPGVEDAPEQTEDGYGADDEERAIVSGRRDDRGGDRHREEQHAEERGRRRHDADVEIAPHLKARGHRTRG